MGIVRSAIGHVIRDILDMKMRVLCCQITRNRKAMKVPWWWWKMLFCSVIIAGMHVAMIVSTGYVPPVVYITVGAILAAWPIMLLLDYWEASREEKLANDIKKNGIKRKRSKVPKVKASLPNHPDNGSD